ncbi:MAG: hypothetical protein HOQ32_07860 [Lysobacter sp.]|nr:hypothetical protein [Lysobacter sp.]
MEDSIWYDNHSEDGGVDRLYCLSFSSFSDEHWSVLSKAYKTLPGWSGELDDGCPCWFGTSQSAQFLIASVEPSGLHVFGSLNEEHLQQWHVAFLRAMSSLPTFSV